MKQDVSRQIESALRDIRGKSKSNTVTVTQSLAAFGNYKHRPAFQDWIYRLKKGERLPRGRFFVGKKPGRPLILLDEFWI